MEVVEKRVKSERKAIAETLHTLRCSAEHVNMAASYAKLSRSYQRNCEEKKQSLSQSLRSGRYKAKETILLC